MKQILFLDFDGVLHPFPVPANPAHLFCFLPRLETALRGLPQLEIVVSSSWREGRALDELRKLFSEDIGQRITGMTPCLEIQSSEDLKFVRQREILLYLAQQSQPVKWAALDDDPDLFSLDCTNLIPCPDGFGEREAAKLKNFFTPNQP